MSYFNVHQQAYMKMLSEIPPENKCWCGWYSLGECPHCPEGKTAADKVATGCKECGNWLSYPDEKELTHRVHCSKNKKERPK